MHDMISLYILTGGIIFVLGLFSIGTEIRQWMVDSRFPGKDFTGYKGEVASALLLLFCMAAWPLVVISFILWRRKRKL